MMEDADIKALDLDDLREAVLAAASAYQTDSFVIVGRASLAVTLPGCNPELRATMDVDLFPPWDEARAAKWAAADTHIGRVSEFRRQHGFYVERVGEWTLKTLPTSWEQRATKLDVEGIHVRVIHPFDLIYAKLQAARHKDLLFVRTALELGLFTSAEVVDFITQNAPDQQLADLLFGRLEASKIMEDEEE